MTIKILTILPQAFSYLDQSMIKRAGDQGQAKVEIHDLRDWTSDVHKSVDDTPYGGGAGMVMMIEPLYRALKSLTKEPAQRKILLMSAKGKTWSQSQARQATALEELIFVCPRYEGVDERILKFVDAEVSIGNYVLTGGELPAMVVLDSIVRLLPGVLGNEASARDESHSEAGVLEYPQYTKPEVFVDNEGKEHRVPEILLSGHHAKIAGWRQQHKQKQD